MNWSNTFNYKNWDFGITLRSSLGNWVYNDARATTSVKEINNTLPLANLNNTSYLFEKTTNELACSSYFVQNASFLRCDNITLGYTGTISSTTISASVSTVHAEPVRDHQIQRP